MAKISIMKVLKSRKKIRFYTILACCLVFAFGVWQVVINNPFKTKAVEPQCYLQSSVDSIPASCENKDVVIEDTTINADAVTVWQPVLTGTQPAAKRVGTACAAPGDSLCDSKRHFKSLTIQNNGLLTHNAVTPAEAAANINGTITVTDDTTGTGRWKKVDIEVDTDITLKARGTINVDAKGYPGGSGYYNFGTSGIDGHINGYGPGFSAGTTGGDETGAGGASYIGAGGSGTTTPGGATYTNNFDFGSGSGAVFLTGGAKVYEGIAGGGRIRLKSLASLQMDITTSISANGGNGAAYRTANTFTSNHYSVTGGGSGGSIEITIAKLITTDTSLNLSVNHGAGGIEHDETGIGGNGGVVGEVDSDINAVATGQIDGLNIPISAAGGSSESWSNSYGGNGGGGRIVMTKITQEGVSINKTLEPVSRGGVVNTGFNPYALQKNDKITVKLGLAGLQIGQSVEIKDEYLAIPGGSVKCQSAVDTSDTAIPNPSINPNSIVWTFSPTSPTQILSYQCTVQ